MLLFHILSRCSVSQRGFCFLCAWRMERKARGRCRKVEGGEKQTIRAAASLRLDAPETCSPPRNVITNGPTGVPHCRDDSYHGPSSDDRSKGRWSFSLLAVMPSPLLRTAIHRVAFL
jgi:hypothetical protein